MTIEREGLAGEVVVGRSELAAAVAAACAERGRLAGLFATRRPEGSVELRAVLAVPHGYRVLGARLPSDDLSYPSVSPAVPSASWYERELHDLYGVEPVGHPRLDPLVLPLPPSAPRPGTTGSTRPLEIDPRALSAHASGEGMFTIPYGPVRSGVNETVEYLIETFGEDIPRVRSRVHHKHRGVGSRFVALSPADGLMLAEVVEGTVSVAHAVAYCRAIEDLSSTVVPVGAELVRLVHLEIERVVNHLDSMIRHTEGSYQVVANARLATHKERLMRLRAAMCSNRFGRGVVVPGGVSGPLRIPPSDARRQLSGIARAVAADLSALMATPSFLDRLRAAGVLLAELVAGHGGLGPVGRGSGLVDDTRSSRPYGAYRTLGFAPAAGREEGDALARQRVRVAELDESFRLVDAALGSLQGMDGCRWREEPGEPADGIALSAVEAPQGELLYLVEVDHGALVAVKPRCAAFHNFALFPRAFRGDILTDFVFIEASFGLSIAGVAG